MANQFPVGTYRFINSNGAIANLQSTINETALTITLDNSGTPPDTSITYNFEAFPDPTTANEEVFTITIDDEIILCHSFDSGTGEITVYNEDVHAYDILGAGETGRGFQGVGETPSGASTHTADTTVYHNVEKESLDQVQLAIIENLENIETRLKKDGSTDFTGDQSMGGFKLTNLAEPTNDNDALRKVDIATLGGDFQGDGSDGALAVSSGTVNLSLDTIYQYTSISITGTGQISTDSVSGNALILKSQGNCTISSSTNPAIALNDMFTISDTVEINTIHSPTVIKQQAGGNGGAGGDGGLNNTYGTGEGAGGTTTNPYGGGGGGGTLNDANVSTHYGGVGGVGGTPIGTGGAGAYGSNSATNTDAGDGGLSAGGGGGAYYNGTPGDEGGAGGGGTYGTNGETPSDAQGCGGGGAGGEGGKSGIPLIMNINGNLNYSGAVINTSGGDGGDGGDGGQSGTIGSAILGSGGGGGGGGGGSASDVLINYTGTLTEGTITQTGGTGGTGGEKGDVNVTAEGDNGDNGSNGDTASAYINKFILNF